MNKTSNFIAGFVTGAVVGSVATLLFAPSEGSNLRDKISYQFSRLKETLQSFVQRREDLVNEAKSQGEANVSKTQLEARKLQDEMVRIQKNIKKKQA
jgi:gas vesicle protein